MAVSESLLCRWSNSVVLAEMMACSSLLCSLCSEALNLLHVTRNSYKCPHFASGTYVFIIISLTGTMYCNFRCGTCATTYAAAGRCHKSCDSATLENCIFRYPPGRVHYSRCLIVKVVCKYLLQPHNLFLQLAHFTSPLFFVSCYLREGSVLLNSLTFRNTGLFLHHIKEDQMKLSTKLQLSHLSESCLQVFVIRL